MIQILRYILYDKNESFTHKYKVLFDLCPPTPDQFYYAFRFLLFYSVFALRWDLAESWGWLLGSSDPSASWVAGVQVCATAPPFSLYISTYWCHRRKILLSKCETFFNLEVVLDLLMWLFVLLESCRSTHAVQTACLVLLNICRGSDADALPVTHRAQMRDCWRVPFAYSSSVVSEHSWLCWSPVLGMSCVLNFGQFDGGNGILFEFASLWETEVECISIHLLAVCISFSVVCLF
jgi:hypothetical protein